MHDWLTLLADPGSSRTIPGLDESVAAARCRIADREVVVVWCRFDVAAGTLSVAAGERFVAALDDAVEAGIPVVAIANSGGARMQEGARGFVQMISATAAVRRVRRAGLPFVVYLAHPTTGGVFASWASLGNVTFAEPGATIGFTGPRVARALGEPIEPPETQTAEGLEAHGLVDAVVAVEDLRARVADVLAVTAPPDRSVAIAVPAEVYEGPTGWAAVEASRTSGRPRLLDEVRARTEVEVELSGDRAGSVGPAVFAGLCRIDGRSMVVIAHRAAGARPGVSDLRVARRAMGVAEQLRLPVVTVIDTPGAAISGAGERDGFAGEIAHSIDALSSLSVPTIAVIAGEGSGGAAMAWLAADVVLAAADSWLAPIAPEAASIIVHRDASQAAAMADEQEVGAVQLRDQGLVSSVVPSDDLLAAVIAAIDARS